MCFLLGFLLGPLCLLDLLLCSLLGFLLCPLGLLGLLLCSLLGFLLCPLGLLCLQGLLLCPLLGFLLRFLLGILLRWLPLLFRFLLRLLLRLLLCSLLCFLLCSQRPLLLFLLRSSLRLRVAILALLSISYAVAGICCQANTRWKTQQQRHRIQTKSVHLFFALRGVL